MALPPLNLSNNQRQEPISGVTGLAFSSGDIIFSGGGAVSAVNGLPTPATALANGIANPTGNAQLLLLLAAGAFFVFVLLHRNR